MLEERRARDGADNDSESGLRRQVCRRARQGQEAAVPQPNAARAASGFAFWRAVGVSKDTRLIQVSASWR